MTDTIALSWSSLGAIAAIVVIAMGAAMAWVHLVIELKLSRRERAWRKWAQYHVNKVEDSVQKPILKDKSKVVMLELQDGVRRFLEDMERELSKDD